MNATYFIIAAAVLLAAADSSLAERLISPIKEFIRSLGSLTEKACDKLKHFMKTPTPPSPANLILSLFYLKGSLGWSMLDSILLAFSLEVILPGQSTSLISTGFKPVDIFLHKHLFIALSLAIILITTLILHFIIDYLQRTYPQVMQPAFVIFVILTLIGIILFLCLLRSMGTIASGRINELVSSGNYAFPVDLIKENAKLSTGLLIIGIFSAAICFQLGFFSTIHQLSQLGVGLFLYVPLFLIWLALVILMLLLNAVERIVDIPIKAIKAIKDFIKDLFDRNKHKGSGGISSILLIIGLGILAQGCGTSAMPKLVVVAIDLSGSFNQMKEPTLKKVDEIIECIDSEDQFYCLFICENSFKDKRMIYLLPNTNTSIQGNLQYMKDRDDVNKAIADVVLSQNSKRTDITGVIQRCQDIFSSNGRGYDKYLFIFSDLSDNLNVESSKLLLDSVNINVLFAGIDQQMYEKAQNNIDSWTQVLRKTGALTVKIMGYDISNSFSIEKYLNERITP